MNITEFPKLQKNKTPPLLSTLIQNIHFFFTLSFQENVSFNGTSGGTIMETRSH